MCTFEYYFSGEVNTNNFHEILNNGKLTIPRLDNNSFVAALALNEYISIQNIKTGGNKRVDLCIDGYVFNMRGDKDTYWLANLLEKLDNINININEIQHETHHKLNYIGPNAHELKEFISKQLHFQFYKNKNSVLFLGADKSVPRFCEVDVNANKIRENGKIKEVIVPELDYTSFDNIVIVDDIIGGGGTIKMIVEKIREMGFEGRFLGWTAYNEGIHNTILNHFHSFDVGERIV